MKKVPFVDITAAETQRRIFTDFLIFPLYLYSVISRQPILYVGLIFFPIFPFYLPAPADLRCDGLIRLYPYLRL